MNTFDVSLPELGFVAATRAIGGVGIGLLLADCFDTAQRRRALGWTLLGVAALTTIPIALTVIDRHQQGAGHVPETTAFDPPRTFAGSQ